MRKVNKILSLMLVLLMASFALAGCGGGEKKDSNANSDNTNSKPIAIDEIKTIGDAFEVAPEDSQWAVYDNKVIFVLQSGESYYRFIADISEADQQAYMDIDYSDPDFEAKQHAIVDPLVITKTEELTDQILSQEELDALIGKTGKELADDGWTYQGSYNLEDMEVWMDKGPFEYSVKFDGKIAENTDDLDIAEATKDMKVVAAEFNGFGDATNLE